MNHVHRRFILVSLILLPLTIIILFMNLTDQASSLEEVHNKPEILVSPLVTTETNKLEMLSQIGGGGYAQSVAISESHAYLGESNGFRILDISNPMTPTLLSQIALTDIVISIDIVGSLAYIANYNNGLQIIDVTTPTNPVMLGNYLALSQVVDVKVVADLAYVTYGFFDESGMTILDVTNSMAPIVLSDYPIQGGAHGIDVKNGIAYIASPETGLVLLDVTIPLTPTLIANYDTPGVTENVHVVENIAYIADGGSGLQIVDVTTPTSPELLGHYDAQHYAKDVYVVEDLAYVAETGSGGLVIIDVTIPTTPVFRGEYEVFNALEVQTTGSQAYVTAQSGLYIVAVSNPDDPTLTSHYYPDIYTMVEVVEDAIYAAAGQNGLYVLDVSESATPTIHTIYDYATYGIVKANNQVYANGDGFQILDISNPFTPTFLGSYLGTVEVKQVTNDLAYSLNQYWCGKFRICNSLHIIDVSDPISPSLLSSYFLGDFNYYGADVPIGDVRIKNGFAYMTLSNEQGSILRIVDVRDSLAPIVVSDFALTSKPTGFFQLSGNLVYAALGSGGLQVIDVSSPYTPFTYASYPTIAVDKLLIEGDLVFTTSSNYVQARSRYSLEEVLADYALSAINNLKVDGNLLYVTGNGILTTLRVDVEVDVTRHFLPFVLTH